PDRIKQLATWSRVLDGPARPDIDTSNSAAGHLLAAPDAPLAIRMLLPLPRPLPDHDLRITPLGDLHVQLLAPGIGTFEATRPDVILARSSAFGNRLLLDTRSRFLSHEKTADSRLPVGPLFQVPTTLRPNPRVFTIQP